MLSSTDSDLASGEFYFIGLILTDFMPMFHYKRTVKRYLVLSRCKRKKSAQRMQNMHFRRLCSILLEKSFDPGDVKGGDQRGFVCHDNPKFPYLYSGLFIK